MHPQDIFNKLFVCKLSSFLTLKPICMWIEKVTRKLECIYEEHES